MKPGENYLKKELYQLIKSNESIFDFLQESALDGLWYWDLENPEQEWMNPRFWTALGYDPAEMPHRADAWQHIIDPDDLNLAFENAQKHFKDPAHPYDQEVRYQHKKGHTVWIRCRGLAIRNESGTPIRMLGAHTDITDLKMKELEQEQSITRLKTIISSSGGLVFIIKEDLNIAEFYVRDSNELLISPDKFIGKSLESIDFPSDTLPEIIDTVKEAFSTVTSRDLEYSLNLPKGTEYFFLTVNIIQDKLGKGPEAVCVIRDITSQKRASQAIEKGKHELDFFFNNSLYGAFFMMLEKPITWNEKADKEKLLDYVMDHQKMTRINQAMLDQYGATEKDFVGFTPRSFFPNDLNYAKKVWRELFNRGNYLVETNEKRMDGTDLFIEGHYICLYNDKGDITGHFGIQQDVTARKMAHQQLLESESRNKSYVENAPYGVFVADENGKYLEANKAAEQLTGYSVAELLQMSIPDLWAAEGKENGSNAVDQLYQKGQADAEILFRLKSGESRLMNVRAIRLSENRFLGFVNDIHEQRYAEIKINESRKKYQMLADLTLEGILIHDQGNVMEYNKAFAHIFGYNDQELLGKNVITELAHPEDQLMIQEGLKKEKTNQFIIRGIKKDGLVIPIEVEGHKIQYNNKTLRVTAVRDVSERIEAQQKLVQSQQQLEKLTNNVPGILFQLYIDQKGEMEFTFLSNHVTLIGEEVNDLYQNPQNAFRDIHPADQSKFYQSIAEANKTLSLWIQEYRVIKKNKLSWYKGTAQPEAQEDGRILWSGIIQDVTDQKQIDESLQEEKTRLANILEGTRAGTWEWNVQTGETIFNENWANMVGYTLEELMPVSIETWMKFAHPEDLKISDQLLQECFNGKSDYYEFESRMKHKNGEWIWVLDRGKVTEWTDDGKPLKMAGTHQEITERKKAEHSLKNSREQLQKLTENVPGTIFQVEKSADGKFNIKFLSRNNDDENLISNLKTTPEDYFRVLHPEDVLSLKKAFDASIDHLSDFAVEYRTIENEATVWNKVTAKAEKYDNGCIVWYGIRQDITEKKKAEEALEEAKTLAEAANTAKSDFLANMSHEIRTPLNGVIGFTDLLLKTKLDDTQLQYMNTVHQSGNTLLETINDILDFSKIEAGKLELFAEKVDFIELGSKIVDLIKFQAHKKNLEILLNIPNGLPRFIWVDEIRLKQILVNLLGNAVKFTDQGEIELKIELLENLSEQEGAFRFTVRDTGVGIGERNQKRIFEAFSQEDVSTTRKFGGTGLGLSISNKLLAMMGSELKLESELGKGSLFYFDLRLKAADGESVGWNCSEIKHHYKNILIVDDNENNRIILQQMFKSEGINSTTAGNGLEALHEISAGNSFDVVLMDYHMPYMDGLETVKKIRNELKLTSDDQPVILIHSSANDEELINKCRKFGVSQFLVKPVTMKQLCLVLMKTKEMEQDKSEVLVKPDLSEAQGKGIRILIVEDNEINMMLARSIISQLLSEAEVLEAINGTEAVKICLEQQPDLVFMDIQMPDTNGYDATREIRSKLDKHIPIIALTAGTVKGESERCKEAGMDDYIAKPVVQETIEAVIAKWLQPKSGALKPGLQFNVEQDESDPIHFDSQQLNEKISNDEQLLSNILSKTSVFLDKAIKDLEIYYRENKPDAFRELLHNIKGTAANVCLTHLERITITLLQYFEQGEKDKIPACMVKIASEIQAVKQEISQYKIMK